MLVIAHKKLSQALCVNEKGHNDIHCEVSTSSHERERIEWANNLNRGSKCLSKKEPSSCRHHHLSSAATPKHIHTATCERVEINFGFEIFTKFTRSARPALLRLFRHWKVLYESMAATQRQKASERDTKSHVSGWQQAALAECSIKHFSMKLLLCFSLVKIKSKVETHWVELQMMKHGSAHISTCKQLWLFTSSRIMRQARCFMKHFQWQCFAEFEFEF